MSCPSLFMFILDQLETDYLPLVIFSRISVRLSQKCVQIDSLEFKAKGWILIFLNLIEKPDTNKNRHKSENGSLHARWLNPGFYNVRRFSDDIMTLELHSSESKILFSFESYDFNKKWAFQAKNDHFDETLRSFWSKMTIFSANW